MTSVGFRIPTVVWLSVVGCVLCVRAENVEIVTPENIKTGTEPPKNVTAPPDDSYVRAYAEVQKLRLGPASRNDFYEPPEKDKQGDYNTVIRSSYLAEDRYPPLTHHWPPPHLPHLPPHADHAPCPPAHHSHFSPHSAPPDSALLLHLLPKKLSLKLLAKIFLKLVLFKMMVKFIAVICLLLFIPLLKSKGASAEAGEDMRSGRRLDALSHAIWGGIEGKHWLYGADGKLKDDTDIAMEQLEDDDDDDDEGFFSGPLKAVRFLQFCVSTVDRVVGFILGALRRRRNEGDDLTSFLFEKIKNFVKNL